MQIPPRQRFIPQVRAALMSPYSPPLYLHGPSSTAKQATLRAAAPHGASFTVIDCILHHSERLLFSAIPAADDAAAATSTAPALVAALQHAAPSALPPHRQRVIIFTRAERLASASFPASTLPLLFDLPSLSSRPDLRIVLISRIPFSALRHAHTHPLPTPSTIFFPPLTGDEVLFMLEFDPARLPMSLPAPIAPKAPAYYHGFARSVIDILYPFTNNPHYLQRVIDLLFPEYLSPFADPSVQFNPLVAFNHVRDKLTHVLKNITPLLPSIAPTTTAATAAARHPDDKTHNLPRTSRILLIAAFLATVVAPTHDTRLFTPERTSRRTPNQKIAANNAVPLERLLAIYNAIRPLNDDDDGMPNSGDSPHDVESTAVSAVTSTSMLIHMSTLVDLGWLSRDGGSDSLSDPKFRCKLSRHEAGVLATTVGIPLEDFLVFDKISAS